MGRVVHFEIEADDPARATAFYKEVFGWHIEPWEGAHEYWLIMTGDKGADIKGREGDGIDGAILRRRGPQPTYENPTSAFVCLVEVKDIDEACQLVTKHGGNVMVEKMEVPGVGYRCYCKDTEGNIFGMLQTAA